MMRKEPPALSSPQDLLNPSDKQLTIREHPDLGVYVQDIAELVVKSAEEVVRLLDQVRVPSLPSADPSLPLLHATQKAAAPSLLH